MGLFRDMLKGVRLKDPVRGQARVVSCSAYRGGDTVQDCRLQLVVWADGVPETPVQHNDSAPADRWPERGGRLPVTIDRTNPRRIRVEWDEVEPVGAAGRHDPIAAVLRGEPGSRAAPPGSLAARGIDAVNPAGRDFGAMSAEQRVKLQMLGIDPSLLQSGQSGAAPVAPPQEAVSAADTQVDDRLARLARLGHLRDAGVLTQAEFEQHRRRIAGS